MSESLLGQRITWRVVSYSHTYDFDRARVTGKSPRVRVEHTSTTRTGVVWSAGPVTGTAWVIPDQRGQGEGHAVCVQISQDGEHIARPADTERSTAEGHGAILAKLKFGTAVRTYQGSRGAAPVNAKTAPAAVLVETAA